MGDRRFDDLGLRQRERGRNSEKDDESTHEAAPRIGVAANISGVTRSVVDRGSVSGDSRQRYLESKSTVYLRITRPVADCMTITTSRKGSWTTRDEVSSSTISLPRVSGVTRML